MKSLFSVLILALCTSLSGICQSKADSAKVVISQFFDAMRNADTTALRACLAPTAFFQTIAPDGIKTQPVQEFLAAVASAKPGELDEQIEIESIKMDGLLISIWAPYQFFYKTQLHHRGANSFQLVKLGASWKIQYVIDTRQPVKGKKE